MFLLNKDLCRVEYTLTEQLGVCYSTNNGLHPGLDRQG